MKIVCFGDSITESGKKGGWTEQLQRQLGHTHQIINRGIGGNTTMQALDRFASDVLPHHADFVLIEFGINDAYVNLHTQISRQSVGEYERNLREIVRLVRLQGARPILVVNHWPATAGREHSQGNGAPLEANLEPYNATVKRLARELEVPTIDFPAYLEAHPADFLSEDKVHLSPNGQAIYARLVLETLLPLLV